MQRRGNEKHNRAKGCVAMISSVEVGGAVNEATSDKETTADVDDRN